MSREFIGYYQSDIRTSRKENSDYDMTYTSQQALIDKLQQENQKLKKQLDYALKLLSEIYPPCDIDGFMDKHSDYCQMNCGVDEDVFKKCWLLYIEEKLKEVE